MIEPRGIRLHLHRREGSQVSCNESSSSLRTELLVQVDEPERPIHPGFEYEVLASPEDDDHVDPQHSPERPEQEQTEASSALPERSKWNRHKRTIKLLVSFLFLVLSGTGNVVAMKLQAIPMYNYPNFLNIFSHMMYIPICFAYIIPVARYGLFNRSISPDHIAIPRKPFAVMGALDCLATSMQVFAAVYLPGPLLVLLPQAVIPCSMLFSRYILRARYHAKQYWGAAVVLLGILVVLEPVVTRRRAPDFSCQAWNMDEDCSTCKGELTEEMCLSHLATTDDVWYLGSANNATGSTLCQWLPYEEMPTHDEGLVFFWSLVMLASTIPMTLSTIYKEVALGGETELDPVYLNGWIAIFQFIFSLVIAIPAGILASPSVKPLDLPQNMWQGMLCFSGKGSIHTGCHPDDYCSHHAALLVCLCLVCNVFYTSFMLFVLKYGSSSTLFMAQTVLVPIGNLVFALPFMPQATSLHVSDLFGLTVIMSGLILYRFMDDPEEAEEEIPERELDAAADGTTPWFQEVMQQMREPLIQTGDV